MASSPSRTDWIALVESVQADLQQSKDPSLGAGIIGDSCEFPLAPEGETPSRTGLEQAPEAETGAYAASILQEGSEGALPKDAAQPSQSGQAPQKGCHCLEFDSWWNEGNDRRCVYIRYNITEGAFQMAIDEDSNLYHVPLAYGARTGEPVTVWDLHVGAELDILGRMTTLQRCSQTTAQWNRFWSDRLVALRSRLVSELRKYDTRKSEPWLTFNKGNPEAGSVDLRLLMSQVAGLSSLLHEYRPRLAAQLSVPQEMFQIEDIPKQKKKSSAQSAVAK